MSLSAAVPLPVASSPQHEPATIFADVAALLPLIKRPDERDRSLRIWLVRSGVCGRSPDGLEAYKEWSHGCAAKFDARDCEKVYMSADAGHGNFVAAMSLYYSAAADSPREYQAMNPTMAARQATPTPSLAASDMAKTAAPAKEPAAWSMAASSMLKRMGDVHATYAFLE
jgi:hypothetical protein